MHSRAVLLLSKCPAVLSLAAVNVLRMIAALRTGAVFYEARYSRGAWVGGGGYAYDKTYLQMTKLVITIRNSDCCAASGWEIKPADLPVCS